MIERPTGASEKLTVTACVSVTARTHGLNDTQTSRPSVSSDVVFASADDRLE